MLSILKRPSNAKTHMIAMFLLIVPGLSFAQVVQREATKEKLKTTVKLHLGSTTLAQFAKSLTEQTSLPIQAADYLTEHRIIVETEGIPASTLLSSLAELNDWEWRETDEGGIIISRKPPHRPSRFSEVPKALNSALPRDFRAYLGFYQPEPPPKSRGDEGLKQIGVYLDRVIIPRHLMRIDALTREIADELGNKLLAITTRNTVPVSSMPSEIRERLALSMVLNALGTSCKSESDYTLLTGCMYPYQAEPGNAEIRIQTGNFGVGSTETNGLYRGFAVQIR